MKILVSGFGSNREGFDEPVLMNDQRILKHYADDIVLYSPYALKRLGEMSKGKVQGKELLGKYFSIGLQASLICYMVCSFFASVAYIWYIYYLIAYAIAFIRSYRTEKEAEMKEGKISVGDWQTV